MKRAIICLAVLTVVGVGVYFMFGNKKGTNTGNTPGDVGNESFTAKIELQIYSVTISGKIKKENKDKIVVNVQSPQEMEDFSVEFDKNNKEKPVKLKFKDLEYNVGDSATPLTTSIGATANLLVLLNKDSKDSELSITDNTFGEIKLTKKGNEIILKNNNGKLKVRIYDFE